MVSANRLSQLATMLVVGFLIPPAHADAQRDFSDVDVTAHHVAGSVYYLAGSGGNIGLSVGEDGVVMIDDQFAGLTDKILGGDPRVDRRGDPLRRQYARAWRSHGWKREPRENGRSDPRPG